MKYKFVSSLSEQSKKDIDTFIEDSKNAREIKRANAVLLSSKNINIDTISDIYEVDRDTVSRWIDWWNELGVYGLKDSFHTGRIPKLTRIQQIEVIQMVKNSPRKLKLTVAEIEKKWSKKVSVKTIKRIIKKKNLDGNELENH